MAQDLEVAVKANKELHWLLEGAEDREANAKGKLRLEKQLREGKGHILNMNQVIRIFLHC